MSICISKQGPGNADANGQDPMENHCTNLSLKPDNRYLMKFVGFF